MSRLINILSNNITGSKSFNLNVDVDVKHPLAQFNRLDNKLIVLPENPNDAVYIKVGTAEYITYTSPIDITQNFADGHFKIKSKRYSLWSDEVSLPAINVSSVPVTAVDFGKKVYVIGGNPNVNATNDLFAKLEGFYNADFELLITDADTDGIHIYHHNDYGLTIEQFGQLNANNQSFYIQASGSKITIVHNGSVNSFTNAVYYLLSELGFNYAHVTSAWETSPASISALNITGQVLTARMKSKGIFATGGWQPPFELQVNKYQQFQERNLVNADLPDTGHAFQGFYSANATYIDAHPEILMDYGWTKININLNSPLTLPLIRQWILKPFYDIINANPNALASAFPDIIGVGPADGVGYDDAYMSSPYPEITNGGEKNYWIANKCCQYIDEFEAEERIRRNDPSFTISTMGGMYAYGDGVNAMAVPSFAPNKRLKITMIPRLFQRRYPSQGAMYEAWNTARQQNNMPALGIYDYWGYTESSRCLPTIDNSTINSLQEWMGWNMDSVNFETTLSVYASIVQWCAFQKLNYNSNTTYSELQDKLLTQLFESIEPEANGLLGGAGYYVRRMMVRWQAGFNNLAEMPYAHDDLKKAMQAATTDVVKDRIYDLMGYVNYCRMYIEYINAPTSAGYLELVQYMYDGYERHWVHTGALLSFYIGTAAIRPAFSGAKNWEQLKPVIQNYFDAGVEKYSLANLLTYHTTDFTKLKPHPARPRAEIGVWINYTRLLPSKDGQLTLNYQSNTDGYPISIQGEGISEQLALQNVTQEVDRDIPANYVWNKLTTQASLKKGATYFVNWGYYYKPGSGEYAHSRVSPDRNELLFRGFGGESFPNGGWYPTWFFYMPKDCNEVYIDTFYTEFNIGFRKKTDPVGWLFIKDGRYNYGTDFSNVFFGRTLKNGVEVNYIRPTYQASACVPIDITVSGSFTVSLWVKGGGWQADWNRDLQIESNGVNLHTIYLERLDYEDWHFVQFEATLTSENTNFCFSQTDNQGSGIMFTDVRLTPITGAGNISNGNMAVVESPIALSEERRAGEYVNLEHTSNPYTRKRVSGSTGWVRDKLYVPPAARGECLMLIASTPFIKFVNIENFGTNVPFEHED